MGFSPLLLYLACSRFVLSDVFVQALFFVHQWPNKVVGGLVGELK